jgi:urea transporter
MLTYGVGMDDALLHAGLYGFNGILVGLCLATFAFQVCCLSS